MAELMTLARASQEIISGMGENAHEVAVAVDLYKNMKRFVVYAEAKAIVTNVPDTKAFRGMATTPCEI